MLDGLSVWIGFNIVLVVLLALDLFVLSRRDHVIGLKEAGMLTVLWNAIAFLVAGWEFEYGTTREGTQYIASYVANLALSADNLFVFLVVFGYFMLPRKFHSKGLLFGIVGALLARAVFIAVGVAVIAAFSWFLYVLGAFLVYTAYKLAFAGESEVDPGKNLVLRLFKRLMPVSEEYHGTSFFTRLPSGVLAATPFLLVVLVIGTTDVVFAIDSVPTVFGITDDAFVIWSSTAMSVLAMRPLFFLLEGLVKLFRFLQFGLSAILAFVGLKLIAEEAFPDFHVTTEDGDIFISMGVIIGVLALSILISALFPASEQELAHATSEQEHVHDVAQT